MVEQTRMWMEQGVENICEASFTPPFGGAGGGYCAIDITRPYQQITFQYSLHWIEEDGGKLNHSDYLGDSVNDPRRAWGIRPHHFLPHQRRNHLSP